MRAAPSWVVVNKPAGMLSVPGKGPEKADCVAARVRALYPDSTGPLIVHRLDMDTSGLLVLGLTPDAQRELSRQFEHRETSKRYVALVEGRVEQEEGEIDLPMRLDPDNRPYQVIDWSHGRGAQTRYRVTAYETDRTRLELTPITGRSHQLRVHCAAARSVGGLGRPIIGDVLYWRGVGVAGAREQTGAIRLIGAESATAHAPEGRLMLHAQMLGFRCPETAERVEVESGAEF